MSTTVLQPEFEVHQMEFQKLLEDRRAVYVPKKLQDTGNEYEVRLTEAVLNNNVSEVESLLQNHMDEIDMYKGVRGLPPLFTAAMTNRTEICNLLLKLGLADPNKIASRWRTTPLRLAVKGGHIEVVKILLNAGGWQATCEETKFDTSGPVDCPLVCDRSLMSVVLASMQHHTPRPPAHTFTSTCHAIPFPITVSIGQISVLALSSSVSFAFQVPVWMFPTRRAMRILCCTWPCETRAAAA